MHYYKILIVFLLLILLTNFNYYSIFIIFNVLLYFIYICNRAVLYIRKPVESFICIV